MSSERLFRNVGSGLVSQAWTALLGLFALPVLVRGLGAERYGLLALCLAIIGFAAVADLGVGRAASKYLAEDYERNESHRTQIFVSTAATITLVTSVIATAILLLIAPLLVQHVFRIPPRLHREGIVAISLTSIGLLPVLGRILFDGILAGHHRIAFLNLTNMLANTLKIGLSVGAIWSGFSLVAVVTANVTVSYFHAALLWWQTRRHFREEVRIRAGWDGAVARQLLLLGSVSTLSWLVGNVIFLYLDRFMIAIFLPLAYTGYYATAFDITSKQWYVSSSISQAFLPVFSGKSVTSAAELARSYVDATKAVAIGTSGLAMLLMVFGRELLTYWINPEFAAQSTQSLVILAAGLAVSAYVTIPYTAIVVAAAKPAVTVRFFSIAVVLHVATSLALLRVWGVVGVAVGFGVAYLFVFAASLRWVSRNLVDLSLGETLRRCFLVPWLCAAAAGAAYFVLVKPHLRSLPLVLAAFAIGYLGYLALCAFAALDRGERAHLLTLTRRTLLLRS